MNGTELLARYQRDRSEDAFRDLVGAYGPLVYSVALRRLYSPGLAEEAMQTVFTRLAASAPRIASDGALAAWLHRTATRVSIDLWRAESRRRAREEEAAAMHTTTDDGEPLWERIAPELDGALDRLGDADRQAVLLRFFQKKAMREVGEAMGISEAAARMRVGRALERLRGHLPSAGAACGTAALAQLLTDRSVEAAPASALAAASLGFQASGVGLLTGAGMATRLLMIMTKTKTALMAGALLLAGVGLVRWQSMTHSSAPPTAASPSAVSEQPARLGPKGPGRVPPWKHGDVVREDDPEGLERLKEELREMLRMPAASKGYPPPELVRLLFRFGGNLKDAAPVLIEGMKSQDYETRVWALSGLGQVMAYLRQDPARGAAYAETMEQARPVLASMMKSPGTPQLVQMQALAIYLPPQIQDPRAPAQSMPLGSDAVEDLLGALSASRKGDQGFRYSVADALRRHFETRPEDAAAFQTAITAMLREGGREDRLLAASALASWPGEKTSEVKDELTRALRERSSAYSHHAVEALGRMGDAAADAVPDILAYGEAMKGMGKSYQEAAIEAACRIQPELRSQFPEVDAKLKLEERPPTVKVQSFTMEEWVAHLSDPRNGSSLDAVRQMIQANPNPEVVRDQITLQLEKALANAPNDRRGLIQSLLQAVREADSWSVDSSAQAEPAKHPDIPMVSLAMDAKVLLVDADRATLLKFEPILARFEGRGEGDLRPTVTGERFAEMEKALREADPAFAAKWRTEVLRNYPWLDRVIASSGKK